VDKDGKRIYFDPESTEEFKRQFAEVVQFMNEKGTSYNLAKLEASDKIYYIKEGGLDKGVPVNQFIHNKNEKSPEQIILWNPNYYVETMEQIYLSPATILAHELGHAARYDRISKSNNPKEVMDYKNGKNPESDETYGTIEEKIVIRTTERYAAIKHGEILPGQQARYSYEVKRFHSTYGATHQKVIDHIINHNSIYNGTY